MMRGRLLALAALLAITAPAIAQQTDAGPSRAAGVDVFYSSDAEDTEVLKGGLNLDWHYRGPEEYQGIRLEKARFTPLGQRGKSFDRAYFRAADRIGGWKW